jgi:hypothetical protein
MKRWRFVPCLAVIVAAAGCASSRQYYQPTEAAGGTTMEGYQVASYDLTGPQGALGEAKLYSPGAQYGESPTGKQTVIDVAVEVENTGSVPASIDGRDIILESVQLKKGMLKDVRPTDTSGDRTIPPDQVGTLHAYYVLPEGISPGDVKAFRVRWSVRADGLRYTEFTPFAQTPEYAYAYVPSFGYYYPFLPPSYSFYDPFYYPGGYALDVVEPPSRRIEIRPEPASQRAERTPERE